MKVKLRRTQNSTTRLQFAHSLCTMTLILCSQAAFLVDVIRCSICLPFLFILAFIFAFAIKVATVLTKLPQAIAINRSPQTTICKIHIKRQENAFLAVITTLLPWTWYHVYFPGKNVEMTTLHIWFSVAYTIHHQPTFLVLQSLDGK